MKCPLFFVGHTTVLPAEEAGVNDCLKEECAWWAEGMKRCAIVTLVAALETIEDTLDFIAKELTRLK